MNIRVDHDLCQGHGQCQDAAPAVFEVRDDGLAYVLTDEIGIGVEPGVRDAFDRCPVGAIVIDAGAA